MEKRKKTKVDLLLSLLKDGGWHSNNELARVVGLRYGDAVFKARRLGYKILTAQVGLEYCYRWNAPSFD